MLNKTGEPGDAKPSLTLTSPSQKWEALSLQISSVLYFCTHRLKKLQIEGLKVLCSFRYTVIEMGRQRKKQNMIHIMVLN